MADKLRQQRHPADLSRGWRGIIVAFAPIVSRRSLVTVALATASTTIAVVPQATAVSLQAARPDVPARARVHEGAFTLLADRRLIRVDLAEPKAFARPKRPSDVLSPRLYPRWRIVDSRRVAAYRDRLGRFAALYIAKTSAGQMCSILASGNGSGRGFGGGCSPRRLFFRAGHRVSGLSTRLFAGVAANEVTRVVLVGSRGKRHVPRLSSDGGFIFDCLAYNGCACLVAWLDAYDASGRRVMHENWLGSSCPRRR